MERQRPMCAWTNCAAQSVDVSILGRPTKEITKQSKATEGHRSETRQNKLLEEGKTKVAYPKGRHNSSPSLAVDVAPYPINWNDRERFHLFAGYVLGMARRMGYTLRWGGDWNMNFEVGDNQFDDFPHFEIRD